MRKTFIEQNTFGSLDNQYKFNEGGALKKCPVDIFSERARRRAGKRTETGLYYYGARFYDPRVSFWYGVDPLVEQTGDAYGYCYQNPINLVDPDGREATGDFFSKNGKYLGNDKIDDKKVYVTDQKTIDTNSRDGVVNWDAVKSSDSTTDFTEKYGLTINQLLDRANWIFAEGGGDFPEYYAFAMNNFKAKAGSEKDMYKYGMQDTDPATNKVRRLDKEKYFSGSYENQQGKPFWNARNNLSKLTSVMEATIASVIKTQMEPTLDPTSGCNQWRGGKGSGEIQLTDDGIYYHRFFKLGIKYSGQARTIDTSKKTIKK